MHRIALGACALALLLAAGCSEDSAVVRPEPSNEPAFSYELYCDAEGHITTDGPVLALIRRPEHLQRVYADAVRRSPRAVELVRELEVVIAQAGTAMAERASAPHCLVMPELGCLPHWPFLDELFGDAPEARHLREVFARAYEARARQRGVENAVIVATVNLLLAHGVVEGVVEKAAAAEARAAAPGPQVITRFGPKLEKQLGKRGWSRESVETTIQHPHRIVETRDARHLSGGERLNEPATAYINEDGSYVVRNDKTGDVVQVSDRGDPNWQSSFK